MISLQGLSNDLIDAIKIGKEKVIERYSPNAVMVRSSGGCFGIRYMRTTSGGGRTDTYEFCTTQRKAHQLAKDRNLIPKKAV